MTPSFYKPLEMLLLRSRDDKTYGPEWQKWKIQMSGGRVYLQSQMHWSGEKKHGLRVLDVAWADHVPLAGLAVAGLRLSNFDKTASEQFVIEEV